MLLDKGNKLLTGQSWEQSGESIWICLKERTRKLLNRRFSNISSSEFLTALHKLITKHILWGQNEINEIKIYQSNPSHDSINLAKYNIDPDNISDLVIFLFRFIGLKSKDKIVYSEDIESKGRLAQDWMYHYSNSKLTKLFEVPEFKILFQYVYYNHLESMFNNDSRSSFNKAEYLNVFHEFNKRILKSEDQPNIHKLNL